MDHFIRTALQQPPLDPVRERELAERARRGDQHAHDELVLAGLRPVALHALMLGARGEILRDAVQAGIVAWITALGRFDPTRGLRLSTYAWKWVRGAVTAEMRAELSALEPPHDVASERERNAAEDWLTGLDPLSADLLRLRFGLVDGTPTMTRREVAEQLGLTVAVARRIEVEAMRQLRGRLARIVTRAPEHSAPVPYSSIGRAADC